MIPILGDLGKVGKLGLEIGEEALEEAVEKVAKEAAEELLEKSTKEALEEVTEKILEESGEEIVEKVAKETVEEVVEKTAKEFGEVLVKIAGEEAVEKTARNVTDETISKVIKDTVAIPEASVEKVSKTLAEDTVEETLEQVDEEAAKFISSLREKYGDEMVDTFLPFCKKYDINPYEVLTRPPAEGQTLIGWGLGIENPANPANHSLVKLNLTKEELNNILEKSTVRSDSKIVVLGYGGGSAKPYYTLSDEIGCCHLSLPADVWAPFENARANFLVDINIPFIEKGIEARKIFVFNIDKKVITDPRNIERFSLPELRLIELEKNNYVQVSLKEYTAYIPIELLDTFEQYLHPNLIS